MAQGLNRVRTEEADWPGIFPWVRLFRSFRMAIHPPKMLLALLLVVLFYLSGRVLDFVWQSSVAPDEIKQYASMSAADFSRWMRTQEGDEGAMRQQQLRTLLSMADDPDVDAAVQAPDRFNRARAMINGYYTQKRQQLLDLARQSPDQVNKDQIEATLWQLQTERVGRLAELRDMEPMGVFAASLHFTLGAFDRGVNGAASLNFGLSDLLRDTPGDATSVAAALHDLFVVLPGWLYRTHFWFMFVYLGLALVLWSVIGGAITRMAAMQAARGDSGPAAEALAYSLSRFFWFFFTPIFPLLLSLMLGLALMLGGLVFFNFPFLDVLGGLVFVVALVCGFIIALMLLLTAGGAHLFYPALAVEGTDAFDAIGRCFGYLIGRPWRWLFYTLLSMVYFAITYLFVGAVLLLTLSVTQAFIRAAVFTEAGGVNRFDAILPPPRLGQLVYQVDWSMLSLPGKAAAALVWVWVFLTVGLLAAYAVSYYCSVHTWIYLLLRHSSDGTLLEDIFIPPIEPGDSPPPQGAPAKIESPPAPPEAVGTANDGVSEENTDQ